MKLKHHHQKRGPSYRKERRALRRNGIPLTTVVSNEEFNELVADLQETRDAPDPNIVQSNKCKRCGEYDPNPCLTPGGAIAKNRHAGRSDG